MVVSLFRLGLIRRLRANYFWFIDSLSWACSFSLIERLELFFGLGVFLVFGLFHHWLRVVLFSKPLCNASNLSCVVETWDISLPLLLSDVRVESLLGVFKKRAVLVGWVRLVLHNFVLCLFHINVSHELCESQVFGLTVQWVHVHSVLKKLSSCS